MKHLPPSIVRLLVLLLTAGALAGPASEGSANAAPLQVRVRGTAKVTARATREQSPSGTGELVFRGSLTDDAGQALAAQTLTARVTRDGAPHDPRTAEVMRGARGCDMPLDASAAGPSGGEGQADPASARDASSRDRAKFVVSGTAEAPELVMTTDEEGRFCFRAKLTPTRYRASIVYAPTDASLIDGVERELLFDLTRQSLALHFDPTPRIVQLDAPITTVEAVAIVDDDATPRVAPDLVLSLSNENEELARATTDASGRARFIVHTTKLGPPGPGELRVAFAGDDDTSRATHTAEIERHAKVTLRVPAAERDDLDAAVPEDGIPLLVLAQLTATGDEPRDEPDDASSLSEGFVEARIGDVTVGSAPVERGTAKLVLTFTAHGDEAMVRLRYVPASPWFEPLFEPVVRVPLRAPSLASKAPILLAGLAVLVFFLIGRVSGRTQHAPEPGRSTASDADRGDGKPRLDVIRAATASRDGWSGRVIDAHDRTPVETARVWIERGTFDERRIVASTETDRLGRFSLPGIDDGVGDHSIVAEGRLYARLSQDLPGAGEVEIALVQRKRALLERLVKWARRRGDPFDARPEPTPGHVRRAARNEGPTAQWADAVERTVFGPADVDAQAEQAVEQLAPDERPNSFAVGQPARPPSDD